jgi:hypothetical protein
MSCRAVEGLAGPSLAQRHRKVAERVADVLMRRSGGMAAHALYGVNAATSYLLMLAAMTFNVGVFVAVCSGVAPPHACAGADLQCATRAVQSRESIKVSQFLRHAANTGSSNGGFRATTETMAGSVCGFQSTHSVNSYALLGWCFWWAVIHMLGSSARR